jgi:hypothetical protein
MKMTTAQFEQIWLTVDSDYSGKIEHDEVPDIIKGYEVWNYSRDYVKSME